jgi:UDP-glucose 6-dehydrogenase
MKYFLKHLSSKWNFNVYYPGAGVGGHCLPVDPYYLVKKAKELGYYSKVIAAGRSINDNMPLHILSLVQDALNELEKSLKNSNIVVLGFSYKENVGDPRESPAKTLIKNLKIIREDMKYISKSLYDTLLSGHLEEHDILITTRGDIGLVGYVTEEFKNSNINVQICLLRVINNEEMMSQFLLQFISSKYGKKQFLELQTGSALKQLPRKT